MNNIIKTLSIILLTMGSTLLSCFKVTTLRKKKKIVALVDKKNLITKNKDDDKDKEAINDDKQIDNKESSDVTEAEEEVVEEDSDDENNEENNDENEDENDIESSKDTSSDKKEEKALVKQEEPQEKEVSKAQADPQPESVDRENIDNNKDAQNNQPQDQVELIGDNEYNSIDNIVINYKKSFRNVDMQNRHLSNNDFYHKRFQGFVNNAIKNDRKIVISIYTSDALNNTNLQKNLNYFRIDFLKDLLCKKYNVNPQQIVIQNDKNIFKNDDPSFVNAKKHYNGQNDRFAVVSLQ